MKQLFLIILLLGILPGLTLAQGEDAETTIEDIFKGTRLVNEHSVGVVDKGKLILLIHHRFGEISGGFYELFGLDDAAMRIGFEYGFGNNFTAGFGRSSYLKTYDIFGKVRIVEQNTNIPITAAVTAAASVPTLRNYFPAGNDNFSDKLSGNVQLHLASTFNNFGVQISPGYLTTGYLLQHGESLSVFTTSFAASVKISNDVTANVEYLANFNSDLSGNDPLSIGVDVETGGHLFQLILSNSQRMFTNGLYTAPNGDLREGEVYFGFNLIREFRIKYY